MRGRARPCFRTRFTRPVAVLPAWTSFGGYWRAQCYRITRASSPSCGRASRSSTDRAGRLLRRLDGTLCRTRRPLAGLRAIVTPGSSNAGSDFGRTCCAMLTAVSAACFTVDSTVLRVSFHTEFAMETDVSIRSPTNRIARDSTTVPSLTSVRKTSPASLCTQSRVTTAAPRLGKPHLTRRVDRGFAKAVGLEVEVGFQHGRFLRRGWRGLALHWRLSPIYRHRLEETH